jgi:RNA 3'-terminal phosphate cyclase (ATP)
MIAIDGSFGEGGGQILRTSLTLSALTGKPLAIQNIRANRRHPGLRAQHLAAVNAIAKITGAESRGAELSASRVQIFPGKPRGGSYQFNIVTAGALTLVLQTIFLPLSLAEKPSIISLTGGTHVRWSPIWDYIRDCWLPLMKHLGFHGEIDLKKGGFYPRGGGKALVNIKPAVPLKSFICTDRGELVRIRGFSGVANLEDSIAKRQKHQALQRLYDICQDSKIKTVTLPSPGKGTFLILEAEFSNCGCACFSALGAPGKPAEEVADEAVDELIAFLDTNGCVDQYMADQILLPLSIIPGESEFRTNRVTQHLLTNIHVIQQFLPVRIILDGTIGTPGSVKIKGTAL